MQNFLNKKTLVQKIKWTRCVINLIDSILNHIADATICEWGHDSGDIDVMSLPISEFNEIENAISSEMKRQGFRLDHCIEVSQNRKPWTLFETDPMFVAIIIALNFHIFSQDSEIFKLIDTPYFFLNEQPFVLLLNCLKKNPNQNTYASCLELEAYNLFQAFNDQIFRITVGSIWKISCTS